MDRRLAPAELLVLTLILLVALGLRLWGLEQNGWGAEYYTAAVRSMLHGGHNFYYAAFDPGGFISVDKPPVALWVQALSAAVFGFSPLSLLAPQAVIGILSIWLTFVMVRRATALPPALMAATLMTFSPLLVAVNRANNMDSCLLLTLLVASVLFLRAAEVGSRKLLGLAAAALGLAFNVKMLAALVVLPAFIVVYGLMAPIAWRRRCVDLSMAAVILVVVSLAWAVSVELTAPADRPYVGGTRGNSIFELIVGHNAANRFFSPTKKLATAPAKQEAGEPAGDSDGVASGPAESSARSRSAVPARSGVREMIITVLKREFVSTPPGPLRLAQGLMAAQFAWFLPLALAGLVLGFRRKHAAVNIPEGDDANFRRALWFFALWAATCWTLYSSLGGIIHYYYLVPILPPLSALTGIGATLLWRQANQSGRGLLFLVAVLLVSAVWQGYVHADALAGTPIAVFPSSVGWPNVPLLAMIVGCATGLVGLLAIGWRKAGDRVHHGLGWVTAVGLSSLFILPIAWSLSTVLIPGAGLLPSADLYRLVAAQDKYFANATLRQWKPADTKALAQFLSANRGEARYLLATTTTMIAAPLIIETDSAVLVRGGFHGLDQALNPEQLASLVIRGDLRYALVGDVSTIAKRMGGDAADKPLADWIRQHGKRVDPLLWRTAPTRGNIELFDLRPDLASVIPSSWPQGTCIQRTPSNPAANCAAQG